MEKHWHYKFVGFNQKKAHPNGGEQIMFPVEVLVKGDFDEADALDVIKQKIKRKHYYCKEAWECDTCNFQQEQVETQKKALKVIEKISNEFHENWFTRLFLKKNGKQDD